MSHGYRVDYCILNTGIFFVMLRYITDEQLAAYQRDGILALKNFVSDENCDQMRASAGRIVEAFDPNEHRVAFKTNNYVTKNEPAGGEKQTDDYDSHRSGDKVTCFFEDGAFDDKGDLKQEKFLSINKIAHALHDLDPDFEAFSRAADVESVAYDIGFISPLLLQSMYIYKQPRIGAEIACHQDSTFLHTEPLSVVGFWFALEDATIENGCMYALPGQHKGPLKEHNYRNDAGDMVTDTLDETPWPEEEGVPFEVKKGTLVIFDGKLPHWSAPNRSTKSRQAYVVHIIEGEAHYRADNWLQRPENMPLRGF